MKMTKKQLKKWIVALDSGKYTQEKQRLGRFTDEEEKYKKELILLGVK
jgi:hypothetical protein